MRIVPLLLTLLLTLFGLTFAILNASPVKVNYYVGIVEAPLSLVLLCCVSLGLLIGLLVSLVGYLKAKREQRHLRKRMQLLEQEIDNLRSIPIKHV